MARATDPGWLKLGNSTVPDPRQTQLSSRLRGDARLSDVRDVRKDIQEMGGESRRSEVRELRGASQFSDIRELRGGVGQDEHMPFELRADRSVRAPIQPPQLGVGEALVQYRDALLDDAAVVEALQRGDLSRAIVLLLHENHILRRELEASQADFNELRAVNVSIQDQMNEALGVADDQRVLLIEELERTREEKDALEYQTEQARVCHEGELAELRQELDATELQLFDLGAKLADCESRLKLGT